MAATSDLAAARLRPIVESRGVPRILTRQEITAGANRLRKAPEVATGLHDRLVGQFEASKLVPQQT